MQWADRLTTSRFQRLAINIGTSVHGLGWRALVIVAVVGLLSPALLPGRPAQAGQLLASGRLWAYQNAFDPALMRLWDLSTDTSTSFTPRGGIAGGVAHDSSDGNIWTATLILGQRNGSPAYVSDGLIHKNPPQGGGDIRAIPDPTVGDPAFNNNTYSTGGPGLGGLDYDSEENVLWAIASQKTAGGSAKFYKISLATGATLQACTLPATGTPIDSIAVAHPADLGGQKVILTDLGDVLDQPRQLFAIDQFCTIKQTYTLPVSVTGIDEDPISGDLIVGNVGNQLYNLGQAPYSTIKSTFSGAEPVKDISLEAGAPPSADVGVTMADSPDPVVPGQNVTYTIDVRNNGPSGATNATFTSQAPNNATVRSGTIPPGWTCRNPPTDGAVVINCSKPVLAAGTTDTFTVVAQVDSSAPDDTLISNSAHISSTTTDPNSSNNTATATTTVKRMADVGVTIGDSPDPVASGHNITYTIGIRNAGPSDATNVVLTGHAPNNTRVRSGTIPPGWTCTAPPKDGAATVSCSKPRLPVGASDTFTVVVKVNGNVRAGTIISATVGVSNAIADPNSGNNTATATTTVK